MGYFSHMGVVLSGHDSLDQAIADLQLMTTVSGTFLMSTSGANGGIASYEIGTQGALTLVDTHFFSAAQQTLGSAEISVLEVDGVTHIVTGSIGNETLLGQSLNTNGQLGNTNTISGFNGASGEMSAMVDISLSGGNFVFLAENGGSIVDVYRITSNTNASHLSNSSVADTNNSYATNVIDMAEATVDQNTFLLTLSSSENGVSCFAVTNADGALAQCDSFGAAQGLGISAATDLEVVSAFGETYAVIAAAGSSSLSVLKVAENGDLSYCDHILDTQHTRFGGVTAVTSIDINGQIFVIAGGADDGLSLFTLLPGGRLQYLETIEYDGANGLNNIESIVATELDQNIQLFVAAGGGAGISQFTVDLPQLGNNQLGDSGANVLIGTGGSEILSGGDGDDQISGGFGTDFIHDGAGNDVMTGGAGRDVFILSADGDTDIILDFQPYNDRLDLSAFTMLYSHKQLVFTATETGAIIEYRDEVIELTHRDSKPLTLYQVLWGSFKGPNRPNFNIVTQHDGTADDDRFIGSYAVDLMTGKNGNDILHGMAGSDRLAGGNGHDQLFGGASDDNLRGNAGADVLHGGDGADLLRGGQGHDQLYGGADDDVLHGDAGGDTLDGNAGDDMIWGGDGNDTVDLGSGNDTAHLGAGNDRAEGQSGADEINGDAGHDRIFGQGGNDTLSGGDNHDTLSGGDGNDHISGGSGADKIFGNAGNDQLWGNQGDDICKLGGGDDFASGGLGNDILTGAGGKDHLVGGSGHDTLSGGHGADRIYGGKGRDICQGGKANDTLTGNQGHDVFLFQASDGRDTITDFTSGEDLIHLDIDGLRFQDLLITAGNHQVKVNYGSGILILEELVVEDLSARDFTFG